MRAKHQKNCQYKKQRTQFHNFPSPMHEITSLCFSENWMVLRQQ